MPGIEPGMPADDALAAVWSMLRAEGVDADDIDAATAAGTLPLLAVERLIVPDPPRHDLRAGAERSGLSTEQLAHLWRSLGFPVPWPGELVFTDDDVDLLSEIAVLIAADDDSTGLVMQASRVIGSSIARIASAQIDLVSAAAARPGEAGARHARAEADDADGTAEDAGDGTERHAHPTPDEVAARIVVRAATLLPVVPRVLGTTWRLHLRAAARRRLALAGVEQVAAVGFADLVGFTALSQQVTDDELAAIVEQFEQLTFDVVTHAGGRVVKMIGDEVMFTVDSPVAAAEIALALAEGTRQTDELSDVRVGLAYGPLLERENDLYGPVVNLASRMTAIALPGAILVDAAMHEHLVDRHEYRLRAMRPRFLKDIGRVPLWVLRRAASVESRFAERREALREAVRVRPDTDDGPGRAGTPPG